MRWIRMDWGDNMRVWICLHVLERLVLAVYSGNGQLHDDGEDDHDEHNPEDIDYVSIKDHHNHG